MDQKEESVHAEQLYKKAHGRYWREKKAGLNHYNIPTTRRQILSHCMDSKLGYELQAIIGLGPTHAEYMMRLAIFSWQVYFLFQLTYQGKDGKYKKLPTEQYADWLFLGPAERPEELSTKYITDEYREPAFRIYKTISDALCPMIAHIGAERFWPSYIAYLVDYIIQAQGDVPSPDVENMIVPYPKNYPRPWDEDKDFLPSEIAI